MRRTSKLTPAVFAVVAVLAVLGVLAFLLAAGGSDGPEPAVQASPSDGRDVTTTTTDGPSMADAVEHSDEIVKNGLGDTAVDMTDIPLPGAPSTPSTTVPETKAIDPAAVRQDCMAVANEFLMLLEPALAAPDGETKVRAALAEADRWCDDSMMFNLTKTFDGWMVTRSQLDAAPPGSAPAQPQDPSMPNIPGSPAAPPETP